MGSSASSHTERAAPASTKAVASGISIEKEQQRGVRGHTCMRSSGSEVDLTKIAVNETNTAVKDNHDAKEEKLISFEEKSENNFEEEDCDDVTVDTDYEDSDIDSDFDEINEANEDEEVSQILQDAAKLKVLAQAFLHPENPIATDPTQFGRNFFDRASAPAAESREEAEERAGILADAKALKNAAVDYMHPEVGVKTSNDGSCFGRNYFSRASAPETEDPAMTLERELVFSDLEKMKKAAKDYLHPEIGVKTTDGTIFGRNYFNRPSAPMMEDDELADDREEILADMRSLKKLAVDYMHPEIGVKTSDGAALGRNYFTRSLATEIEDTEMAEERAKVLAETESLKKFAADYMHPEFGVKKSDGTSFGRNYFNRQSAPEMEDNEIANERADILAELKSLKKLAVDYMHPEVGVKSSDGAAFGRNYFNRPSAPDTEEDDLADDREEILADMRSLKKLAVDYMHPEVGVKSSDGAAFGRNYFTRPSAIETEYLFVANERAEILAEMKSLKKLAVDYMHPEFGVETCDGVLFGRNYFDRPSAIETEYLFVANERAEILAEMKSLKKLAVDYTHPEVGVKSSDGATFGRNYFNRPSATETDDEETVKARAEILADMLNLKKLAVDYMHPEVGVKTSDGAAFGRNYFGPEKSAVYSESTAQTMPVGVTPIETDMNEMESHDSSMFEFEDENFDFAEMRSTFSTFVPTRSEASPVPLKTDEEEGHLSRSPSSVMLI